MINEHKQIQMFEGNTCYTGVSRDSYNLYEIHFTRDMAWELVGNLLSELKDPKETRFSICVFEELPEAE